MRKKLTAKETNAIWEYFHQGMVPGAIARKVQRHINTVKAIVDPEYIAAIRERNARLVNKPGRKFKKPEPAIQKPIEVEAEALPASGISKSGIPYLSHFKELRYGDKVRRVRISLPRITLLEVCDE